MTTPEGKIKKKVRELLKAKGCWFFAPQAGPYGRSGIPDFIGCRPGDGKAFGIECKADASKEPTALQKAERDKMKAGTAYWYLVCDDETLKEVAKMLRYWEE